MVSFLQDHNCVLHVAVHKVNPEVGPVCLSSPTPLHRSPDSCQNIWEGEPIDLVLPGGGYLSLPPPHTTSTRDFLEKRRVMHGPFPSRFRILLAVMELSGIIAHCVIVSI